MPRQRWRIFPPQPQEACHLAQSTGLSPLLAQVLLNRGVQTQEQAKEFLNPELLLLPSPLEEFPDLPLSLELLVEAITNQQKIAICGDYDADGMTSTALLLRALRFLGADVDYAIPSRMQEGYGVNQRIVEDFYAEGVGVILTVDNGIAAYQPIARARELGLTVIVTDHHDIPPKLPPANAILNPKLIRADSPYRGVAGVGVAYILAICLAQCLQKTQDLTAPLLELFTLGTIADLAPLTGVNRRWVRRGLKLLPRSRIPGVQALIQVAGLGDKQAGLKPEAIGFRLGPRINAVGRIANPQIVIEMLTTDDIGVALQRAMQCEEANQLRRRMCEIIEEQAIALCEQAQQEGKLDLHRDRVLVVVQPEWHHGVIGIVASRLVERYGVPVFIGTYEDEEQKEIRGSARGIPEFNVFDALQSCHDLLDKFGGHRAAGGFSFKAKHLRQVRSRLINFAVQQLQPEHLQPLVTVDVEATLSQLSKSQYDQIDRIHPCGIENPDPVFWTPNVRIVEQRTIGKDNAHLKLTLTSAEETDTGGPRPEMKAIAWRWGDYCPLPERLDIAYKLQLNEWKGRQSVELELIGVREPRLPHGQNGSLKTFTVPGTALPLAPQSQAVVAESSSSLAASPTDQLPSAPDLEADPCHLLAAGAGFYYSKRRYVSSFARVGSSSELRIQNLAGQVLLVQLPQRQGFLSLSGQAPRPVDVSEPYYFNLIQAGLNALEIKQKTQLLMAKDDLLCEKESHLETLRHQIALLEETLSQLPIHQQKQFQVLQTERQQQKTTIQNQEAYMLELQSQLSQSSHSLPTPQDIRRLVREALGKKVWDCLQSRSQQDLYIAHKNHLLIQAEELDPQLVDYSEAGLYFCETVHREVSQTIHHNLYEFLLANGGSTIGGLDLSLLKANMLPILPPLLAEEWSSFDPNILQHCQATANQTLYASMSAGYPITLQERTLISQFLAQWKHPIGRWLRISPSSAASTLDQISQLRHIAAHAEKFLYPWQFDLLKKLIIGTDTKLGLFQEIYGR
ncbi:MAG: single-stranded-DNA-specific exonuclease RecJ [Leptolyngbyaceae cyanobacterium MO_188.B28]|nr:single-stranded-DNA-specific exonuclease RecJ [Leptolyngbyaceae cyanobacterium MO_188.B28]